jgi:hypothetical protein
VFFDYRRARQRRWWAFFESFLILKKNRFSFIFLICKKNCDFYRMQGHGHGVPGRQ